MTYELKGGAFPVVVCQLADGEKMVTEKGSMVWMSPNMEMSTSGGGLGKMFSKAFSGESMFQNIYTARGAGMIAFGSSFPGRILPLTIQPGREVILQKTAFLAAETGVNLSIHFNKKMGTGFFGGEGFIMQRLSGSGIAFAEVDGELVEYTLGPGQQMVVDTGNVLGFEGGVSIDIQQVKGLKNKPRNKVVFQVVNLDRLAELFPDGGEIGPAELAEAGAVRRNQPVKVLGSGDLGGVALTVSAHAFSESAKEKIAAAGGSVTEL